MEPRARGDCFCVMVFVLGTFQEGRRETWAGGGNAASARAPRRRDPRKAADDCRTCLSARQHAVASIPNGGLKKRGFQTSDALWTASEPPQANDEPCFELEFGELPTERQFFNVSMLILAQFASP